MVDRGVVHLPVLVVGRGWEAATGSRTLTLENAAMLASLIAIFRFIAAIVSVMICGGLPIDSMSLWHRSNRRRPRVDLLGIGANAILAIGDHLVS